MKNTHKQQQRFREQKWCLDLGQPCILETSDSHCPLSAGRTPPHTPHANARGEALQQTSPLLLPSSVPAPTHILDADGQLCLKVTKILGQLITMVIESEESLQEGQ